MKHADPCEFGATKPSLQELSRVLRDRRLWPDGFKWDYSDIDKCAWALARCLWPDQVSPILSEAHLAFNMHVVDVFQIFACMNSSDNPFRRLLSLFLYGCASYISPRQVADAIDKYLRVHGTPRVHSSWYPAAYRRVHYGD
jgi:hypothetical protein